MIKAEYVRNKSEGNEIEEKRMKEEDDSLYDTDFKLHRVLRCSRERRLLSGDHDCHMFGAAGSIVYSRFYHVLRTVPLHKAGDLGPSFTL